MKRMKKILALLLAAVMVMSLGSTAVWAADASITITGVATNDHTFKAWQIFDGSVSSDETTLGDVVWGSGVDTGSETTIYTKLADVTITGDSGSTINPFTSDESSSGKALTTAAAVATALAKYYSITEIADKFATVISQYLTTAATITSFIATGDNGTYTYKATVSDPGYYLVKDVTTSLTGYDAYTDFILLVVGEATQAVKSSVPSVTKAVTNTKGTESSVTSASAEDTVSFTLTATMPSTYADYSKYGVVFNDTLSSGLTFNGGVTVTVNTYVKASGISGFADDTTYYTYDSSSGEYVKVDKETESFESGSTYYTLETSTVDDDCYAVASTYKEAENLTEFVSGVTYYTETNEVYTEVTGTEPVSGTTYYYVSSFTVTIENTNGLKQTNSAIEVNSSSTIVVEYTATVNANISSSNAETNAVNLTYSNNPNNESSTGTTTISTVYVHTFDLNVYKTDGSDAALEGASFTLYKLVTNSSESNISSYYTYTENATAMTSADSTSYSSTTNCYVKVKTVNTTGDSSSNYVATFNDLGEGTYVLEESKTPAGYNTAELVKFEITATYSEDAASVTGLTADNEKVTVEANYTTLKTTVANNAGSKIPTTGGIGTTIFYIVGAVLVLGAGVILITRRRMGNRA